MMKHLECQNQTLTNWNGEMGLVFTFDYGSCFFCCTPTFSLLLLFFLLSLHMHLWTRHNSLNFFTCWVSVRNRPHHLLLEVMAA